MRIRLKLERLHAMLCAAFFILHSSFFISCKDCDEKEVAVTIQGAETQVTIVFGPGQLGAMSSNDYLQLQLQQFAQANSSSVESSFICRNTLSATRQAVKDWACGALGDGGTFKRRLLILSEPTLMMLLDGVTLRETDHVLMLKTWLDDAKKKSPAGRTHVLNVSMASAVRQAVERRHDIYMREYADKLDTYSKITYGPYYIRRLYAEYHTADSIMETLHEMFPDLPVHYANEENIDADNLIWESGRHNDVADNELIDENEDSADSGEALYLGAYWLWIDPEGTEGELLQPIFFIDYGTFNRSYEWYWITHRDSQWKPQCVIIGEPGNSEEPLDYITPKYDLRGWLDRWLSNPDGMPEEEWNGQAKLDIWENRY